MHIGNLSKATRPIFNLRDKHITPLFFLYSDMSQIWQIYAFFKAEIYYAIKMYTFQMCKNVRGCIHFKCVKMSKLKRANIYIDFKFAKMSRFKMRIYV